MTDPHAHRRFSRIETRAVLPDGRVRTSWNSYPQGVGKAEFDRIDKALTRAFGNIGSRTVGTFMDGDGGTLEVGDPRGTAAHG